MKPPRLALSGRGGCMLGLCLTVAPWLLVAVVALAACTSSGCVFVRGWPSTAKQYVPPPTMGPPAPTPEREESLSEKANRLEGELRAVRADLRDERDKIVRLVVTWSAAICALGCVACFIASVFMPVMKKRLLIGGVAFAAGVAVSITVREAIPWLPYIGFGLLVLGVGATLPTFISHARKVTGS